MTVEEFKGNKVVVLFPEEEGKKRMSMGTAKAKMIIENEGVIRKFADNPAGVMSFGDVEVSEFKGKPVVCLNKSARYKFSFGVDKARKYIEKIDEIKEFVG